MPKKKEIVVVPEIIRKDNQLWTTSLDLAEKFGKRHDNVIRAIENLDLPKDFQLLNFEELTRNLPGGIQKYYMISCKGFSFVALKFTGKKATEWQIKYVNAFEQMAKELERIQQYFSRQAERRGQIEWQKVRAEGKIVRREETDALKEFEEYAKAHGSTHAHTYYFNLTAMLNKIFFGIKKGQLKGKNTRDFMDKDQLFHAAIGDRVIRDTSLEVVRGNIEYHEVTPLTRKKLTNLAAILNPTPLQIVGLNQIEVLN